MRIHLHEIVSAHRTALVIASALVWVSPVARGGILERLENGENLTVTAIGTSLTAVDWGFWFQPTGDWLNGQGFPGKVTLANRAACGSASKHESGTPDYRDGMTQLADMLAKDHPDAVFIEYGINDAYQQYKISKAASRANLQSMIDQICAWAAKENQGKGKNVEIVVQTMNNCVNAHADERPELAQYYQGYREIAQANKGVLFIDTYHKWLDLYNSQPDHATWNSYVPDGIHPNAQGAKGIIVPSVQQALQSQVTAKAAGAAGQAAPVAATAVNGPWFKANTRILFQGDSITDGERNRNDSPHLLLGQGYQFNRQRQAILAKLATKYQAALVKYQKVFDDACKRAPAEFWTADGVHPTYSGHQLMADEWVTTVTQFFK